MAREYDNTNSGFIGKNQRMRAGKRDPELSGTLNVEGKEYWLSGWKNAKGYGLKITPKEDRQQQRRQPQRSEPAPSPGPNYFDDDPDSIPF